MSKDKKGNKDNVIPFPDRGVREQKEIVFEPDDEAFSYKSDDLELRQTMEFVESCVDELSISLIKQFVDIGVKIEKPKFYGDLAMVAEMMRILLYRDFGVHHAGCALIDKMITIKFDDEGQPMPILNYSKVISNEDVKKFEEGIINSLSEKNQLELNLFPEEGDTLHSKRNRELFEEDKDDD